MQNIAEVPSTGVAHDNDDVVVDDSVGGVVLLEANNSRKSAMIINTGEATMRVTTDGTDPTPTRGKQVVAGSALFMGPPYCPTDVVKAIRQDSIDTTANASEVD